MSLSANCCHFLCRFLIYLKEVMIYLNLIIRYVLSFFIGNLKCDVKFTIYLSDYLTRPASAGLKERVFQ